jgi:hypothetical protein
VPGIEPRPVDLYPLGHRGGRVLHTHTHTHTLRLRNGSLYEVPQKVLYLLANWAPLSFLRRAVPLNLRVMLWITPLEQEVVLSLVGKDRPNSVCHLSPCDPSWWRWECRLWQWCWKFVNYEHLIVVVVNCRFVWLLNTALGNILIQKWVSKLPKYARGWYTASQHIIYRFG